MSKKRRGAVDNTMGRAPTLTAGKGNTAFTYVSHVHPSPTSLRPVRPAGIYGLNLQPVATWVQNSRRVFQNTQAHPHTITVTYG